jgi:hypothetical protein
MSVMNSLIEYVLNEFKKNGVNAQANLIGNILEIKVTSDDIKKMILSKVPPEFSSLITIESGDVIIRIRLF